LRSIILVLSLVLGLLPLAGVGWIFAHGMITLVPPSATVDGLFMTLILLTLSLCFLLNVYWEAHDQGMLAFLHKKVPAAAKPATAATGLTRAAVPVSAGAVPATAAAAKTPTAKVSS
jgi:hypothetical protein